MALQLQQNWLYLKLQNRNKVTHQARLLSNACTGGQVYQHPQASPAAGDEWQGQIQINSCQEAVKQ
jgi:hypothetical protein